MRGQSATRFAENPEILWKFGLRRLLGAGRRPKIPLLRVGGAAGLGIRHLRDLRIPAKSNWRGWIPCEIPQDSCDLAPGIISGISNNLACIFHWRLREELTLLAEDQLALVDELGIMGNLDCGSAIFRDILHGKYDHRQFFFLH